jgi:predicted enzyme related to lactoylglutathione lyase
LQFNAQEEDTMNLVSMRVITNDMKRLVSFYEDITGVTATWYTEDFAELATPSCTLAIGSTRTMALFGSGAARAADNQSVIIEFRIDDVDQAYARLRDAISDVVQEPKTMPWGNRSLLFRDPDGNLVNFFTPVSAEAIKKNNP